MPSPPSRLQLGLTSLLDVPCGAMAWQPTMLAEIEAQQPGFRFGGLDIVRSVVEDHRARFGGKKTWSFAVHDITSGPLPGGWLGLELALRPGPHGDLEGSVLPACTPLTETVCCWPNAVILGTAALNSWYFSHCRCCAGGYDLLLTRDALIHLSCTNTTRALQYIANSSARFALIGSHNVTVNEDLDPGACTCLYLETEHACREPSLLLHGTGMHSHMSAHAFKSHDCCARSSTCACRRPGLPPHQPPDPALLPGAPEGVLL